MVMAKLGYAAIFLFGMAVCFGGWRCIEADTGPANFGGVVFAIAGGLVASLGFVFLMTSAGG